MFYWDNNKAEVMLHLQHFTIYFVEGRNAHALASPPASSTVAIWQARSRFGRFDLYKFPERLCFGAFTVEDSNSNLNANVLPSTDACMQPLT